MLEFEPLSQVYVPVFLESELLCERLSAIQVAAFVRPEWHSVSPALLRCDPLKRHSFLPSLADRDRATGIATRAL